MDPNCSAISNGPESADGTLVIIVCRAKHLPNRRKLDKQSPYVTIRMGTTAKKTPSHFRGGQIPEWTHEVRFQLTRERKPVIKLDVLDETKNDPTPIGTCDIDCSAIFSPDNKQDGKYIYDKWYDLTLNGRRAGMIYLEMTFYPSAPVLPPKLYESVSDEGIASVPGSLNSSGYSAKSLPAPPPLHPLKARQPSAVDEVFVSGDTGKRKNFFKTLSAGQVPQTEKEVEEEAEESKSPKKYLNKLNKLKTKFQAKEKISTLWNTDASNRSKLEHNGIEPLDVSQFDNLDQLQNDIQSPIFASPSPIGGYTASPYTTSPGKYYENALSDDECPPPSPPPRSFTPDLGSIASSPTRYPLESKPARKPPPEVELRSNMAKLNMSSDSTGIPFSADTIGLEDANDEDMPTKVYFMDKQVKSLSHKALPLAPDAVNADDIHPRFYAPTPDEHFKRSKPSGMTREMFIVEMSKNDAGYLGNGRWKEETKFSPSIFDRMPNDENLGFENKPHVPPKIPQGLTEEEYYVLEKEKYLKDINGRRS